MPVASFSLVDAFDAAAAVLRRFHAHLAPGGLLLLDVGGLGALAADAPDRRRWTTAEGDLLTCDGVRAATDWFLQRTETLYRYERWRDGGLVETEIDLMRLRHWGVDELRGALVAAGFGDVRVVGGYDRSRPPRSGDRVLSFEARRL